ncbi:ceramide kinase L homeolog isoform X1 [Xenopus laevis]|uniref:Ceramide kinase L homeolog isoform X1 n=1 Tax=Xenopus laevis TaxID=8355 RepID=A0A8J0UNL0_XENLA|nr:ceramide kinase L homeolog isoform X1 [Xenopus laevis]
MESAHSTSLAVLCSVLSVKRQSCEVTLDPGRSLLSWRELRPRHGRERSRPGGVTVPVTEIVSVGEAEIDEKYYNSMKWQHICKPRAFTVRYVQRVRKHRWRCKEVTFWCSDEQLFYQWLQAFHDLLEQQTHRPKNLLVYINPYGGKKRGKQIYENKVAPLFSAAGICADVIVTEYANHARDHLYDANLEKYDGVVCVGGDGMFSEVLHGLIVRMQKDSDVDHNNPSAQLSRCNMRIGIIPAGSTDCICYATVGINDPETSALHIILGDCQPLDVCSVHYKRTFLKYSVSLLGYGFYGDVLKGSEKNRWLGPARYDVSGFKTFLTHHCYEGSVSFQPAKWVLGSPRDQTTCTSGCYICRQSSKQLDEQEQTQACGSEHREQDDDWTTIKGRFMAINAVSMSCACPRSPNGLSPAAHLADGSADLILVRKCSRLDFLRHLIRHTSNKDQFDFPFVEVYRVKNFQFTPKHFEDEDNESTDIGILGKKNFSQICTDHPSCGCNHVNSIWNCDGETLDQTAIEMRVHCQLIKLFARGIENAKLEDDVNPSKVF